MLPKFGSLFSASSYFYRLLRVSELLFLPAVRNRTLSVADFRDLWRSLSKRPCFSAAWYCNVAHFLSDAALLRADCLLPHVQPGVRQCSGTFWDFLLRMPAASEASSVSVDLSAERLRLPPQTVPQAQAVFAFVLGQQLLAQACARSFLPTQADVLRVFQDSLRSATVMTVDAATCS